MDDEPLELASDDWDPPGYSTPTDDVATAKQVRAAVGTYGALAACCVVAAVLAYWVLRW